MLQPAEQKLPMFTRLLDDLQSCGWALAPHERLAAPIAHFQTFQGGHDAPCRALANDRGQRLLLVALEDVQLPAEEELFPRFLDLSIEERMALVLAHVLGGFEWLVLRTRERLDLYRLGDEVCEQRAVTPEDYETGFLPALTALARGRVRAGAAATRQLPGAESLGGWIRHWALQVAATLDVTADHMERVLWKWIIMLQLRRRTGESEAAGGWGLRCEVENGRWAISYDAITATEDLLRALRAFDRFFTTRLLEREEPAFLDRLKLLDETPLIDRLRAELLMHTQNRYEPETVAWLFTDLAREQEGWRREVRGVDPIRKRIQIEGWTVYNPLHCEIDRYGLTAALSDAARLAEYLNELSLYERHREAAEHESARQPDLFRPNPRGIGAEGHLEDGLNFLFGEALRVSGVPPAQRLGIGVTFLLKALALAPAMGWPLLGIDTLDEIFNPPH